MPQFIGVLYLKRFARRSSTRFCLSGDDAFWKSWRRWAQRAAAAYGDRATIPYMLAGSFASAYYGALRTTQDIDVVVAATPDQLRTFVQLLARDESYVDLDAALEAHKRQTMFNVVDLVTGWKIDFIIRMSRAFSEEEFRRGARRAPRM